MKNLLAVMALSLALVMGCSDDDKAGGMEDGGGAKNADKSTSGSPVGGWEGGFTGASYKFSFCFLKSGWVAWNDGPIADAAKFKSRFDKECSIWTADGGIHFDCSSPSAGKSGCKVENTFTWSLSNGILHFQPKSGAPFTAKPSTNVFCPAKLDFQPKCSTK